MAKLDGAKNDEKITVLMQIEQLFPHMRELLIAPTGIIDISRIFRVYPKKGIFFPRFRQKKVSISVYAWEKINFQPICV